MIEFLVSLIEGSQYVTEVNYAIAPILLQGLSFATDLVKGKQAMDKQQVGLDSQLDFAQGDLKRAGSELERLRKGQLTYAPTEEKVSDFAYKAYDMAQSRAPEQMMQQQQDAMLSTMAQYGNMGGSGMFNAFMDQSRQNALAGMSGRQKATQDLAATEQSVAARNAAMRESARQGELDMALQRERAGEVGQFQANTGKRRLEIDKKNRFLNAALDAAPGMITAVDEMGLFSKGAGKGEKKELLGDSSDSVIDSVAKTTGQTIPSSGSGVGSIFAEQQMIKDLANMQTGGKVPLYSTTDYGVAQEEQPEMVNKAATAFEKMLKQLQDDKAKGLVAKHGAKLSYEEGGEVFETEGEFDHDTNKKALVDEETGVKEAELTGGELVFNPEQTSILEELVSLGDEEALMDFLRDLMNEPQFKGE